MRKSRKTMIVGGTTAALLGAGIALAAWTSTGSGTGSATGGEAIDLGVAGSALSGDLFPTVTETSTVTITNPNPYDVKLSGVTFDGAEPDAGHSGCSISSISVAGLAQFADEVVAKDNGTVAKVVEVTMDNTANDACQGADFTLNYTANGASN